MKAYITSIGEKTTDLCIWSLERNGFEVVLIQNPSSLASKLEEIYNRADDDFIRVDADVVPNKILTPDMARAPLTSSIWWLQFLTYDWFKQDATHGGVQFVKAEALPTLRTHVKEAMDKERPESYLYRLEEFHEPRRCQTHPVVVGIHNYKNDPDRVSETKQRRGQYLDYDFELARRLDEL